MKLEFTGHIKDGKFHLRNKRQFDEEILLFSQSDITVTFEKKKSKRSDSQNRLWWVYMTIISKELGYTKNEIHEICKFKFLKAERVDERTGEVFEYLRSSTDLNKSEFGEMVDSLILWAAELKIELPLPNTQIEINI